MKSLFTMLAGYNAWANIRLYQAVAELPDADYRADQGAFFGSIHGTLNHLLVADRIWMARFGGVMPAESRLDSILYEDFAALRSAREAEDFRITAYVQSLSDAQLGGMLHYRTISSPAEIEQPLMFALPHLFNHQTHHRGQVHCLLTKLANEAPSLDLIVYQRETGTGIVTGPATAGPERQRRAYPPTTAA